MAATQGLSGISTANDDVAILLSQVALTVVGMVALVLLVRAMRKATSTNFAAKTRREVMDYTVRRLQREYSNHLLFEPMQSSKSLAAFSEESSSWAELSPNPQQEIDSDTELYR